MTCKECIHKAVCYRVDSVKSDYARKCGDFVSGCKGLEQEPCENAISRAQAIYVASGYCHSANIAKELEKLPSVIPQPKTGYWKRISIDKYSEHSKYWYRCDRCGKDNLGNTDWCPNCGAKMTDKNGDECVDDALMPLIDEGYEPDIQTEVEKG